MLEITTKPPRSWMIGAHAVPVVTNPVGNVTKGLMLAAAFAPIFLLSLFIPMMAEAQHPNFSGTWKLLPQLSNFATATPPKAMTMNIRHQEPALMVQSTTTTAQGEQASEYRWWTDGYPSANTIRSIDYKTNVSWNGKVLVSNSNATTPQGPIDMTDSWTLTNGGKQLQISRVLLIRGQTVEQVYVYQKQ